MILSISTIVFKDSVMSTSITTSMIVLFMYRVLMVDRQESRPMEAVARFLLIPVAKFFPTAITIPIENVAQAMINNAVNATDAPVETFENKDIHVISGQSDMCRGNTK